MRLLFAMDKKDYEKCTDVFVRNSARGILIRDKKIALVHSRKYDYYKFPGGGIEEGEDPRQTLMREVREEAGLLVIPESIREYGYVHRIQKSDRKEAQCFIQDNYYYFFEAEEKRVKQDLDGYEALEGYQLQYVDPLVAIKKHRRKNISSNNRMMLEREALVLELLIREKILG